MRYDMAAKRAERLLGRNWASVQTEAHRLGSLGLPGLNVRVGDQMVSLTLIPLDDRAPWEVNITPDGGVMYQQLQTWQDGHIEAVGYPEPRDTDILGQLLAEALQDAAARAAQLGAAAQVLAAAK